jgi:hypothetical protein
MERAPVLAGQRVWVAYEDGRLGPQAQTDVLCAWGSSKSTLLIC